MGVRGAVHGRDGAVCAECQQSYQAARPQLTVIQQMPVSRSVECPRRRGHVGGWFWGLAGAVGAGPGVVGVLTGALPLWWLCYAAVAPTVCVYLWCQGRSSWSGERLRRAQRHRPHPQRSQGLRPG